MIDKISDSKSVLWEEILEVLIGVVGIVGAIYLLWTLTVFLSP
jgi:hypothetical protein